MSNLALHRTALLQKWQSASLPKEALKLGLLAGALLLPLVLSPPWCSQLPTRPAREHTALRRRHEGRRARWPALCCACTEGRRGCDLRGHAISAVSAASLRPSVYSGRANSPSHSHGRRQQPSSGDASQHTIVQMVGRRQSGTDLAHGGLLEPLRQLFDSEVKALTRATPP